MEECKHDWTYYEVSTGLGYWSTDIEQAGYCRKCGYDTHGEYLKQEEEMLKLIEEVKNKKDGGKK